MSTRRAPCIWTRSAALVARVVVLPVPARALMSTVFAVVLRTAFCSSFGRRWMKGAAGEGGLGHWNQCRRPAGPQESDVK